MGCGTANYLGALAADRSDLFWLGLDLSEPMLRQARLRHPGGSYLVANASRTIPLVDESCALAFAVDVVHHIDDLERFFSEVARILVPGGKLAVVTDSEDDMRARSLTRFFPAILAIELRRYPAIDTLHQTAGRAGLAFTAAEPATGYAELTDEFLDRLRAKCSSAMRLLTDDEHAAGMDSVREAARRGESWFSCYSVLHYERLPRQAFIEGAR